MDDIWTHVLRRGKHDMVLAHCLEGLRELENQRGQCAEVNFEGADGGGLGVTNYDIKYPVSVGTCEHMFGELYVYMSCTGACNDATCPLRQVAHDSCVNVANKDKVFTLTQVPFLRMVPRVSGFILILIVAQV